MIWVQTGVDRVLWLPIYERKGSGKIQPSTGSKGEGVYIDAEGLRHYYDEGGNYYMLESDYLARDDPKPSPKPRRKVVEKNDPFNPKNHTGEIDWSTHKRKALHKGRIIEALKEAVESQCYALDEDIVKGALHLLIGEEE